MPLNTESRIKNGMISPVMPIETNLPNLNYQVNRQHHHEGNLIRNSYQLA